MTSTEAQAEALRRIQTAREFGKDILDLGDLSLESIPREISGLKRLRVLALGMRKPEQQDREIEWSYEGRRQAQSIRDLSPLRELTSLTSLSLWGCVELSDLTPLAGSKTLVYLDLCGCESLSDLTPVGELKHLSHLDLSYCKQISDLSPLAPLRELTYLSLKRCVEVSNLRPLSRLDSLGVLSLSGCRGLSDLTPLSGLSALTSLTLRGCSSILDLSPLAGLHGLTSLNLSRRERGGPFAPLRGLLFHLTRLILYPSFFPDLPTELIGEEYDENVLPAVRAYYDDLEVGAVGDAELKVFLLGNGRVGKTQLARFLLGQGYDANEPSTHGIRLHDQPFDVPGSAHPVRLNLWDFGGQDIYHGSHALFLQGQAVFLILWDPALEVGEFKEAGLTIHNRSLAYWFDYLRTLAGSRRSDGRVVVESPVLLIQSRCESRREERPPPCLPEPDEFPNLYTLTFSARTGRNQHALTETLQEAVGELFSRRRQPLLGVGRAAVRDRIRAMQALGENCRVRTLSRENFHRLCDEEGGVSDADALLQFLHRTGVVFYRPGMFGDRVILDQSWALEAIYAIFHRRTDLQNELRIRGGHFTRELLDRFLWGTIRRELGLEPYSRAEQELFLDMMTQCHIAFQVDNLAESGPDAGREYVAPELLPAWSDRHDIRFRSLLRQLAETEVVLHYDFLHEGIARRFLAQIGTKAKQLAMYWKYGCWFHDARTESEVIVRCEPNPTAERPGEGAISLRAWGTGARPLLLSLTEALLQMPMGQRPRLEPADFFDRATRPAGGDPMIRLQPAHRPRTVFLSYAHSPVTGKLVRGLIARLRDAGTMVAWDEESLSEGESISAFIDSVRTVPVLIAVLSGRYPRSAYCVSELFAFYEACRCQLEEFSGRVVPLVLEDAQIDSDLDRADHATYWANEHERRRPAAAEGRLDVPRYITFQHMQTWQGQVANVLAALADRKSSLRAERIMVDDYRNVLERLEMIYRQLGM